MSLFGIESPLEDESVSANGSPSERAPAPSLTIAVVAHDRSKPALMDWVSRHAAALRPHRLLATGTTGQRIRERFPELDVEAVLSGPLGGDLQIGARVAEGEVDAIVFLIDPLWAPPHESDVRALIRIGALHDVPIAVNLATTELLAAALPGLAAAKGHTSAPTNVAFRSTVPAAASRVPAGRRLVSKVLHTLLPAASPAAVRRV